MIDGQDRKRSTDVEVALQHVSDQERFIRNRAEEVTNTAKPLKERRLRNHYMAEALSLWERNL